MNKLEKPLKIGVKGVPIKRTRYWYCCNMRMPSDSVHEGQTLYMCSECGINFIEYEFKGLVKE